MQNPAKKFIDLLESQELLSEEIIQELRRQVAESKTKLSPELLAKLLVDNGHLTKFQATKLISQFSEPEDEPAKGDDDELGLAGDMEQSTRVSGTASNVAEVFIDDEEIVDVEAVGDEAEVVEVVETVEPVEVVEAVQAVPSGSSSSGLSSAKPSRPYKGKVDKASPWDSFRILGVGLLLALTLIGGFFLVNFFLRGNADDLLERADTLYEQRSYETAANLYKEFPEKFPTHEKSSYAKVRQALALLRKEAEGAPDPVKGLDVALEVLPPIANEPALAEQQSDLAGVLVSLAQKFNDRADSREETAERKELMEEMDKLMDLINNPQFVGSNQRSQQAPSLARIEEDRQRILREINRDEELATTLVEINKKLDAEDTIGAYQVRETLINRYPLLETNPALVELVAKASDIQKRLVGDSTLAVKISQDSGIPETAKVLANRTGSPVNALAGTVVFAKVKGAVLGIDASTGDVLWRKYVGRGFEAEPIRLGDSAKADALVVEPEAGKVSRVLSASGETKWIAEVGEPIHAPLAEGNDMIIATHSGSLASLDPGSGQLKWSKKLPQPVPVTPGTGPRKPNLYVPGEHSNLYVLDRKSGESKEVYYLGHRAGSIAVPPILLAGRLFVFENINSESARVRILSTSEDGLELKTAQSSITIDGNVIVSPQVDRNRVIIQSDLGHIVVLDVEETAATIATVPKNLIRPQISWAVAGDNKIWLADTRFTRFDLQVSLQKLNRAWIKNDRDTFTAPPQLFGNVIIHARTLRGNEGVRVSAVDSESGEPFWETDVGVPIQIVNKAGSSYDVVNSSGALFTLDSKPIRNEADVDPSQGKPATDFSTPTWLSESIGIMLNQSNTNQMAIYGPQKLRILAANFGSAKPSCPATAVGNKIAVGLDNGQLVLVDPSNGAMAASPYQPPMQPGKKVRWNQPLYLSDTLIASSDMKKLVRLTTGEALNVLTEVTLQSPLVGPIVSVGMQVGAVASTKEGDSLRFFNATSLSEEAKVALDGRLVAGPFPVADGVVLQTNTKLIAVSSASQLLWSIDFPNSSLVSTPVVVDDRYICATRAGQVWAIQASTGEVVGKTDLGQALSAAPVLLGSNKLLIGSDEGVVLAVDIPTSIVEVQQ